MTGDGVRGSLSPLPQVNDRRRDDLNTSELVTRQTAVTSVDSGNRIGRRERHGETPTVTETRQRMATVAWKTHANERGEDWVTVACFSAKQGLGFICRVQVHSDILYTTQRANVGEGKTKSLKASYVKGVRDPN